MILAAIDIGSNSVKLLVARTGGAGLEVVKEEIAYTRLGEGIGAGDGLPLSAEAIERTVEAVAKFAGAARAAGAERVHATATEAARHAANAADFLRACRSRGVEVQILSGEEEARLSWLGATAGEPAGPTLVLDVGGGSMELTAGEAGRVTWAVKLPLGAVRLKEKFVAEMPARPSSWTLLEDHVRAALAAVPPDLPGTLLGVGGTVAALAQLVSPRDPWRPIPLEKIRSVSALLRSLQRPQVLALGVPWGREDIVAPGIAVVLLVTQHLGRAELRPVRTGLRYGLLRQFAAPGSP